MYNHTDAKNPANPHKIALSFPSEQTKTRIPGLRREREGRTLKYAPLQSQIPQPTN